MAVGAAALEGEPLRFRAKVNPAARRDSDGHPSGQHDDLVLATALARWAGEHAVPAG